ncbi:MAG: ATP synthase F1 subunit epsilon [Anaerolineae bacterium]|nr:ATP synthase F1 subunit epsilon [Anaerolineae bacterium]
MPLDVRIVTQERLLYEGKADMVVVPGIEGELGILPNHAPLLSRLDYGILRLKHDGDEDDFTVFGGVIEAQPDRVLVLADVGERSEDIDLERAQAARDHIKETLAQGPPPDPGETAAFEAALRRAEVRIKVARRRRGQRAGSVSIRTEASG